AARAASHPSLLAQAQRTPPATIAPGALVAPPTPRRSLLGLAGGAALSALVPERLANAALMSDDVVKRLRGGQWIRVPVDLDLPQGNYFGGIVYAPCVFSVNEIMTIAADPSTYPMILARAREVRVLKQSGREMQVYLRHDVTIGSVSYVLLLRRESRGLLRFWVDL